MECIPVVSCTVYSTMHRHVRCEEHVKFQAVKVLGNYMYTMHMSWRTFCMEKLPSKNC